MNTYRQDVVPDTGPCTQCGVIIRRAESHLTGDGPICRTCQSHAHVADLGPLGMQEEENPETRRCPRCRESSMFLRGVTEHMTRLNGSFPIPSGRSFDFGCALCSYSVTIDSVGRLFLRTLGRGAFAGLLCLVAGEHGTSTTIAVAEWLGAAALVVWSVFDIVQRARHPASR